MSIQRILSTLKKRAKYILRALIKPMQFQTNRCLRSTELHQTILCTWRRAEKYFEGRAIKFVEKKANKQKARQDKRRIRNHQNTQTLNFKGKRWDEEFHMQKRASKRGSWKWRGVKSKEPQVVIWAENIAQKLKYPRCAGKNVKTETLGWKMKAAGNRAKIISLRLIDPRSQASKRFFS